MDYYKRSTGKGYELTLTRSSGAEGDHTVFEWEFTLDASGLAALIRSVDLATSERKMANSIGRKRAKN